MKIKELKYFLNALSTDFKDNKISLKVDNQQYDVRDFKLFNDSLVLCAEEHFKETIFDDVGSTLTCTNWNRDYKLHMVKSLKQSTNIGLKEAKEIIDEDRPFVVAKNKTRAEFEEIVKKFPDHCKFDID